MSEKEAKTVFAVIGVVFCLLVIVGLILKGG